MPLSPDVLDVLDEFTDLVRECQTATVTVTPSTMPAA
jgi:hypothetical protein